MDESSSKKRKFESSFAANIELFQVLGKGRNCVVRFGKTKTDGTPVAVKVIQRNKLSKRKVDAMVQVEIAVLTRLKERLQGHPNLVAMHSMYEEEDAVYIVLEYLQGGELFDQVVARGSYCERDASVLIKTIVSAIDTLHSLSVIHRDLKPENIVFKTKAVDSDVKIIDFGHSKVDYSPSDEEPSHEKKKSGLVGTPGYLAPETISSRYYSPACDVWSTGVILYILLCGYAPFYASTNDRLMQKIVTGDFDFPPEHWDAISDEAKDLVRRMLTVNPAERINCSEILAHPWVAENHRTENLPETIKRLGTFNARRKLRAAAMACVWGASFGRRFKLSGLVKEKQFSAAEMYQIQIAFKQHSTCGAYISKAEFELVMESLRLENLPLGRMYELFDKRKQGQIDYREFLLGLGTLRDDNEQTLKFCFDLFDTDNSGHISREELSALFTHIASESTGSRFDRTEKIARLFERLDSNGDGEISFEEFCQGIKSEPELKEAFILPAKRRLSIRSTSTGIRSSPESSPVCSPSPPRISLQASPRPNLELSPEALASDLFRDDDQISQRFRIEQHQ